MTPEQLQVELPKLAFREAERCAQLINEISALMARPMLKGRVTRKARFQMPKWAWEQWRREFDKGKEQAK